MIFVKFQGRLGNNLIQFFAAKVFQRKIESGIFLHDGKWLAELGIGFDVIEVPKERIRAIEVNDSNFYHFLFSEQTKELRANHYIFSGFFQRKEWLFENKDFIVSSFQPMSNSDHSICEDQIFVHYRIGDIEACRDGRMLDLDYYRKALSLAGCRSGFISSDSPSHKNVETLMREFNLKLFSASPAQTILFGRKFNNIVLGNGTFSWWIGFLSRARNIFYRSRKEIWFGYEIFQAPEWTPV